MSVWNGKHISEMSTAHIINTMSYMKRSAEKLHGKSWRSFVNTVYFDMQDEVARRNAAVNFGETR